jgi:DNA-binding NarL/FixJ family response regulator
MGNNTIKGKSVLILHRHALLCEGLARILKDDGFRVIKEVVTGNSLTIPVLAEKPDIVIIDCDIPDAEKTVLYGLKECMPDAVLIILTTPQPGRGFMPAINAGAQGYLSTNLSAETFIDLVHLLAGGNMVIARENSLMKTKHYTKIILHLSIN